MTLAKFVGHIKETTQWQGSKGTFPQRQSHMQSLVKMGTVKFWPSLSIALAGKIFIT